MGVKEIVKEMDDLGVELGSKLTMSEFPKVIKLKGKQRVDEFEFHLMGKLFSPRWIDDEEVLSQLLKEWKLSGEDIQMEKQAGLFKFSVKRQEVHQKLLKQGPWLVHGYLMNITEWKSMASFRDYDFSGMAIWVQIFDLPLDGFNDEDISNIGQGFGQVLATDKIGGRSYAGSFARVRVVVNVKRQIQRDAMIELDGKLIAIKFKYEKIPKFCYFCGHLGHEFLSCTDYYNHDLVIKATDKRSPARSVLQFSAQLRVVSLDGRGWRRESRRNSSLPSSAPVRNVLGVVTEKEVDNAEAVTVVEDQVNMKTVHIPLNRGEKENMENMGFVQAQKNAVVGMDLSSDKECRSPGLGILAQNPKPKPINSSICRFNLSRPR
ncbi:hypothetical protein ACHQM5_005535 [Ranunculus cassubicifolius]